MGSLTFSMYSGSVLMWSQLMLSFSLFSQIEPGYTIIKSLITFVMFGSSCLIIVIILLMFSLSICYSDYFKRHLVMIVPKRTIMSTHCDHVTIVIKLKNKFFQMFPKSVWHFYSSANQTLFSYCFTMEAA